MALKHETGVNLMAKPELISWSYSIFLIDLVQPTSTKAFGEWMIKVNKLNTFKLRLIYEPRGKKSWACFYQTENNSALLWYLVEDRNMFWGFKLTLYFSKWRMLKAQKARALSGIFYFKAMLEPLKAYPKKYLHIESKIFFRTLSTRSRLSATPPKIVSLIGQINFVSSISR